MKRDTSWGNTFKGFGRILTSKAMLLTFGVVIALYFLVGCSNRWDRMGFLGKLIRDDVITQ